MKKITGLLFIVIALLTSSCTLTQAVPPQPTVIFVPVTVTPEAAPVLPLPSATAEPLPTVSEAPTATLASSTATSDLLHFYVSGYVWHDKCAYVDGPVPNPLPAGCVQEAGVGIYADGIFSAGESGIGGVIVRLEIDCNYGAFTVATDSGGYFSMSFTVPRSAGVSQQRICLSVDALDPVNTALLIPGGWTFPKTNQAKAVIEITIPVEQPNTVNFGWDYQFQ